MPNDLRFDGRVAIVTGAGGGLGRSHALLLGKRGARVVVNDLGGSMRGGGQSTTPAQAVVDEIKAAGGEAVTNFDSVEDGAKIVQCALDTFGQVDIVVNNAGILRDAMSFNITESEWDSVIEVHLKGHLAMCHHAVKHWRALGKSGEDVSGRIINTASESGLYGQAGQINYATAKAGIVSMTIVLAREMKKYGVTANVVCPRALTRMTETVAGAAEFMTGPEWEPENISPIVVFLASDAAADVSGQVFVVWGTRVHLMEGFTLANTIDRGEGRWTPQELADRKAELFAGRRSKIPQFGFGQ
jgi:NAD(P)-dependent dehydrogenase (short-subunit alcohol dehydrogenase family)